ncbi:MAG: DMT family transporter, partial [Alphaproteobacteria bacterium]
MDLRAIIAGVGFALMWSSAFTSARIVVAYAPPFAALSVRFLISGALAMGLAWAMGQRIRLTRRDWIAVILFGLFQNGLYLGLNFFAMQWVEASVAVIVASMLPLAVALGCRIFLGERLRPLAIAGLVIGCGGVVLVMAGRVSAGGVDLAGLALLVLALLALAAATLLLADRLPRGNALMVIGLQMLVGSASLLPVALVLEEWVVDLNWRLVAAFTYTTLFPGILATMVWFWLVRHVGATRAATYHFLNPFLGVAVAALILSESVGPRDLIGVTIVALG